MKSPKRPKKYEAPSWNYIYELCIQVADQIKRSKYKPDLLVAVARGGWIPGRVLSDLLENPNVATIKVEHYVDIYKTLSKPEITQPIPIDVNGKKILLVDDIADSGKSLKLVKEHLLSQGAADVKICALYYKPWSIVVPDFSARMTDAWIWFPHEIFETMKKVYLKLREQGKTRKEIERELLHIGIKPLLIQKFLSQIGGGRTKG
ncbi:MAG: phosphoribosyltransferase [Candidatus Hodarchaeaceae archaeon]|nr:phosphoribosyltransferase [Candidatus Hodarchaeaceae archaeon]